MRREDSNRLSGTLSSPKSHRSAYNRHGRLQDFARLLEVGAVYLLDAACVATLELMYPPSIDLTEEDDRCEAWAQNWLASAGETGARLAERVTGTDVVNL